MHTEDHAHGTTIITPDPPKPGSSPLARWGLLSLIILVGLTVFTVKYFNRPKEYNLFQTPYGCTKDIIIKPGKSAHIQLTNDWCPIWSSDDIITYDKKGNKAILKGCCLVTGTLETANNMAYTFENQSDNAITVRIGRCTSKNDCTIYF